MADGLDRRNPFSANLAWITLPARILGAALIAAALPVLLSAFARFVTEGRGTPAPIAPTERLVVGGLYRYVRNPMHVAAVSAIAGQAFLLGQLVLLGYGAIIWAFMAAFVHWYEEPTLEARHGSQYDAYRKAVPAWLPRLRPADATEVPALDNEADR